MQRVAVGQSSERSSNPRQTWNIRVVRIAMDTSMMMSPRERPSRPSTFDPRQTLLQDFDMSLSLLSTSNLDYSMNYINTNLGFPGVATALQHTQFYSNTNQQPFFVPPSFSLTQEIPEVKEARNAVLSTSGSPSIKTEDGSPGKDAPAFHEISAHQLNTSVAGQDMNFGTDVDTLMRAIQTKSANRPQRARVLPGHDPSCRRSSASDTLAKRSLTELEHDMGGHVSRKKYQCTVPTCAKMFFQKTHLEIHLRAHTGCKPFVRNTWLHLL